MRHLLLLGVLCTGSEVALGADLELTVYRGEPFSVGRLTFDRSAGTRKNAVITEGTSRWATDHLSPNCLYPVTQRSGVSSAVDDATEWSVYFLMDLPTEATETQVTLNLRNQSVKADVQTDPHEHSVFKQKWWKLYVAAAKQRTRKNSPLDIDLYLTTMLARRLNLTPPLKDKTKWGQPWEIDDMVSAMMGTESIRLAMQTDAMMNIHPAEPANLNLPGAIRLPPVPKSDVPEDVVVEAIAQHVPSNCLYVRFQTLENFNWFQNVVDKWGADARGFATTSVIDYEIAKRLQTQLNLPTDQIAETFGSLAVSDIALIGSDIFVNDGAGMGVVFEAKNSAVLQAALTAQRVAAAEADGVNLSDVEFEDGDSGTLLSTADNRIRSFHVNSGDYHLITNSMALTKRFLRVNRSLLPSLGQLSEFRHSRSKYGVDRNDKAFVFLSDPFFRRLLRPEFRIEMARRSRSSAEIGVVEIARLAAKAEGRPHGSIDELKHAKQLPNEFAKRSDQSTLAIQNGHVVDTLRGRRGSFLPIEDVQVKGATKTEVAEYHRFNNTYRRIWTQMDPATVALNETEVAGLKKLIADIYVYPVPRDQMGMIFAFLQPKIDNQRLHLIDDLLIVLEANILGSHSFLGIADDHVHMTVDDDGIDVLEEPDSLLVIGRNKNGSTNGTLTFNLDDIPHGEIGRVRQGWLFFSNNTAWGIHDENFALVSPAKEKLADMFGQLRMEEAERPAQFRLQVGDLGRSKIGRVLNAGFFFEANKLTKRNEDYLNLLATQLKVADISAPSAARRIRNGSLQCALGGKWILKDSGKIVTQPAGEGSSPKVRAAVWSSAASREWSKFRHPKLEELKRFDVELTLQENRIQAHMELVTVAGDKE